MRQRLLDESLVKGVVDKSDQSFDIGKGRTLYQSRYFDELEGKEMLLRIVAEVSPELIKVVTVYKTSKVDKYWRREEG